MLGINSRFPRHHANRRPISNTPAEPDIRASSSQIPAKSNPKLLSFLLQAFIMALVFSLFFVFVGIAVIVFLHLCLVGGALHRRHRTRPHDDQSGLSSAQIRTLPKFMFRGKSGRSSSSELCAICLECVEGDLCRELPDCKHVFHANCVDRWLFKSPGCPVCRTAVRRSNGTEDETTRIADSGGQLWYAFG